jgi:hypothetical protein
MNAKMVLPFLLLVAACKKDETKADPAAKGTEAPAAKPAAAPATWKKVPSMGIEVSVPADADVQDNTASAGFPSSTIYFTDGTPTTFIMGAKDLNDAMALSKDLESTKARIQKEMTGFKAFSKEEKTADGFVLLYSGASMTDPKESLYGVTIRSSAAGLTLDCQTNASSEAEIAKTVAVCKTIRAAK